jgi:hypothetical protein
MLDQLYPQFVATRLNGERVALVGWGPIPNKVENGVRDAVSKGGGRLDSISVYDKPLSLLKQVLGNDQFAIQTADESALMALGRSLGRSIIGGGHLARSLRSAFPDNFAGRFRRADAIVFYEATKPNDSSSDDAGVKERQDDRARTVESALLDELRAQTIAVVGVEAADADPSQISRYKSLQLSSSDSVDKSGGRIALVFALAGAKGHFGFKSSADQPLPDEALTP